jgi:hypothetical protein
MRDVFNRTEEMLVASYEMFLKDLVVSPAFLPVQVTITIASKEGIRIPVCTPFPGGSRMSICTYVTPR